MRSTCMRRGIIASTALILLPMIAAHAEVSFIDRETMGGRAAELDLAMNIARTELPMPETIGLGN